MSDNWENRGLTNHPANFLPLPGGMEYNARNTRTGEWRKVWVHDGQSFGEAIENGQFRDGDDDDENED